MLPDVEQHLEEEDHVVPSTTDSSGTFLTNLSKAPVDLADSLFATALPNAKSVRELPDLWRDIEEILSQDCPALNDDKPKPRSNLTNTKSKPRSNPTPNTKPCKLQLVTPDFAALISPENLASPLPSPAPQEVPGVRCIQPSVNTQHNTPAQSPSPATVPSSDVKKDEDSSLMESSMLISHSMASGCEYHEYDTSNTMDFSRTYGGGSLEVSRPLDIYDLEPEGFSSGVMSGGGVLDDMKERIKYACSVIDIPIDPNSWSTAHVQKWALFVMSQYGLVLDERAISNLPTDGAALTTMTKEDFVMYFPTIGEKLYDEMELWCFAFSCGHVMTTTSSNPIMPQAMPQEVTYTDLDAFKNSTYDIPMTTTLPSLTSAMPCVTSLQSNLTPSIPCNQTYIKQEVVEMGSEQCTEVSPSSSPDYISSTKFSGYPSSSSSCGYASSDETFEERDLKTHVVATRGKHTIQLWQFLKELLIQPQYFGSYIRWQDRVNGIFKIEDSAQVAKLWGGRKNRPAMNYDKLSRSIRQYYKKGIIKKTCQSKRLVYQFCPQYNG